MLESKNVVAHDAMDIINALTHHYLSFVFSCIRLFASVCDDDDDDCRLVKV